MKCRYLNPLGKFMHVYSVFPPARWMCSIQDTINDKSLIEMIDRSSSSPRERESRWFLLWVSPACPMFQVRGWLGLCSERAMSAPRPGQAPPHPLPLPALPFSFTPLKHKQKPPSLLYL